MNYKTPDQSQKQIFKGSFIENGSWILSKRSILVLPKIVIFQNSEPSKKSFEKQVHRNGKQSYKRNSGFCSNTIYSKK